MRIEKCPKCHKEGGFLTFRQTKILSRQYPYVGHYDPTKYSKEKMSYANGKRKSKPNGRRWCLITDFEMLNVDFLDNWYCEYLKLVKRIYQKYNQHGFRDLDYVKIMCEIPHSINLERIRQEFMEEKEWKQIWEKADELLRQNGFPECDTQKRIRSDILWKHVFFRTDSKHPDEILTRILLD